MKKAMKALDVEWERLRKINTWVESEVRERAEVIKEAQSKGQTIHLGDVFDILVEKNFEMDINDPNRKFKGHYFKSHRNIKKF